MAAWLGGMRARGHSDLEVGIFLDDRFIWTAGAHAVDRLAAGLDSNRDLEREFAMKDNVSKRVLFGNAAAVRA
eukprot:5677792-Alexandrium_andersonii.AAC.1